MDSRVRNLRHLRLSLNPKTGRMRLSIKELRVVKPTPVCSHELVFEGVGDLWHRCYCLTCKEEWNV